MTTRREAQKDTPAIPPGTAMTGGTSDRLEGMNAEIAGITNTMINTRGEGPEATKAGTSATTAKRTTIEEIPTKIAGISRETIGTGTTMIEDPERGKKNTGTQRNARMIAGTTTNTTSMTRTDQEITRGAAGRRGRTNTKIKIIKKMTGTKMSTDTQKKLTDTKRNITAKKQTAIRTIGMAPRKTDTAKISIATPRTTATRTNTGTTTMTTNEVVMKDSLTARIAKNINKLTNLDPVAARMISRDLQREGSLDLKIDDCHQNIRLNI